MTLMPGRSKYSCELSLNSSAATAAIGNIASIQNPRIVHPRDCLRIRWRPYRRDCRADNSTVRGRSARRVFLQPGSERHEAHFEVVAANRVAVHQDANQ